MSLSNVIHYWGEGALPSIKNGGEGRQLPPVPTPEQHMHARSQCPGFSHTIIYIIMSLHTAL